ncbi:hypothetical protein GCM10023079_19980 [Streptomyces chitinivorans]
MVQIGIVIGGADGDFDATERTLVREARYALDLPPHEFDLQPSPASRPRRPYVADGRWPERHPHIFYIDVDSHWRPPAQRPARQNGNRRKAWEFPSPRAATSRSARRRRA